jgi:hypothetical protein
MSELRIKKQTVKYNDFKVNFIKIQNKKDIERKIPESVVNISYLLADLLFEMPTKNTLQKLAKRMEPIFLPDDKKYKIELVASDDNSKRISQYWLNLGFEAYIKDTKEGNRFPLFDYIIVKDKISDNKNWIKL